MENANLAAPVRGRPREFDPGMALAAALRVFWARGYEGASMAELTEAMGITKPSLYACFGNKEALFRKALDLYELEKLSYMRTALDAPSAKGVAERLLRGALATQADSSEPNGCLGVITSMPCGAEAESIRAEVIARQASAHSALVERLRRAKAEGDLPAGFEPEALAHYVGAVIQGLCVQAGSGAASAELREMVETTLAIWPGR
jgi:AcrR family transcriptional regulator